jgi:hypothetical protein
MAFFIPLLIILAVIALTVLTVAAVLDVALEYLEGAESLVIVDHNITQALEDIIKKKSSSNAPVKKVVYDKKTKKAVLVVGQRTDSTLEDNYVEAEVK